MFFTDFMAEMYAKAKIVTTDEEWAAIKEGIDIVTRFVVTDNDTWESISEIMGVINELNSAQEFIDVVDNADTNGYNELCAAVETWIWLPEVMETIEYALAAYPIAVSTDDEEEVDLVSSIGMSLVSVYQNYLPTTMEYKAQREAEEAAAAAQIEDPTE